MIKDYEEKSWRKVMKKSYDKEVIIKKYEDYLIESHDKES